MSTGIGFHQRYSAGKCLRSLPPAGEVGGLDDPPGDHLLSVAMAVWGKDVWYPHVSDRGHGEVMEPTEHGLSAGVDRNRCVLDWVELNLGHAKHPETAVYGRLWRLGAAVARGFGNQLEPGDIDDCIHDVMIRICRDERLLVLDYPAAYFTRGVKNACLSKLRSRRADRLEQAPVVEDGPAWEESLVAEAASLDLLFEHAECLQQVMARLNAEQRANLDLALDLRVDGMSAEQVATATGRTARAVTQGVSNFVKVTLRKLIEDVCPGMVQQVTGRLG